MSERSAEHRLAGLALGMQPGLRVEEVQMIGMDGDIVDRRIVARVEIREGDVVLMDSGEGRGRGPFSVCGVGPEDRAVAVLRDLDALATARQYVDALHVLWPETDDPDSVRRRAE